MRSAEFAVTEAGGASQKRTVIDALYRKYHQALRRFLAGQHLDRDEVADVVQETYRRIQESADVEGIRNPKAFLFRVANNVWLNTQKHRRAGIEDEAVDIESLDVASDEPSPYRSIKAEQELAIVRAAIAELAPKCREAFIMNRFENMTFSQIAVELDLSVSMIEKHVSHAISFLRQRLAAARPALDRSTLRLLK